MTCDHGELSRTGGGASMNKTYFTPEGGVGRSGEGPWVP